MDGSCDPIKDKACIEEVNKMKKQTADMEKNLETIAKGFLTQAKDNDDAKDEDAQSNAQTDSATGWMSYFA